MVRPPPDCFDPNVESFDAIETGYPLLVESSFEADDPAVEQIWNVGIRTLQRCMGENEPAYKFRNRLLREAAYRQLVGGDRAADGGNAG